MILQFTLLTLLASSVWTGQYNNNRDNSTASETVLTQSNVTAGKFGFRCSYPTDDFVETQVLVIDGSPSIAIFASMSNTIYAVNADSCPLALVWSTNVGTPAGSEDTFDIQTPNMGCLATGVVDTAARVLYIPCKLVAGWSLYSFNISDGSTFHAPVAIAGSFGGTTFDTAHAWIRPSLSLVNGVLYIVAGSVDNETGWHGCAFSYNPTTLAQNAVWCTAGTGSSIWQSSAGPAFDASFNMYFLTGNGSWNGTTQFGESFVKLTPALGAPTGNNDFFTPSDWAALNTNDIDLGSGHAITFGSFVMGGGKDCKWRVLNQAAMGGLQGGGGPAIVQEFVATACGGSGAYAGIYAGEVYVPGTHTLYLTSVADKIYSYNWNGSTFDTTATASTASSFAYPSATMAYSSNGTAAGTGVLWAVTGSLSSKTTPRAGTLRALDPVTLTEIWNSGSTLGNLVKFIVPSVANGQVWVPTSSSHLVAVFGLLPSSTTRGAATKRGASTQR